MMPDYKTMYLRLFNATEDAINILIAAQRECEEMFVDAAEPQLAALPVQDVRRMSNNVNPAQRDEFPAVCGLCLAWPSNYASPASSPRLGPLSARLAFKQDFAAVRRRST